MRTRAPEADALPEADRVEGCPHPRSTYDLIGHLAAERRFIDAHVSGRLHHAWLISGTPGSGKATLAYRMIRYILGGQAQSDDLLDVPKGDPVAQRLEALGHGDFFLLRRPYDLKTKKIKSEIPVDETRRLRDFFTQKPSEGGWRVCLIDKADQLNRNAENGVLKTLEEPPEKALIILLSDTPGRLLPTIRSRCMPLRLNAVSEPEIMTWLKPRIEADPAILDVAVKLSRGGPGKAFSLVKNAETVLAPLTRFLSSLGRSDARIDHQVANMLSLQNASDSRRLFWEALQDILQAQTQYVVTGQWNSALKPLPVLKTPEVWQGLWERALYLQQREDALNMDKKTVMLDMLSELRG